MLHSYAPVLSANRSPLICTTRTVPGVARCCSATVKDVEGIPDAAGAARSRVTVAELRESDPTTLPVDAIVLDLLERAEHVREIRIVTGLVLGALTAALGGLAAGTTVHAG